ncbi:hypothetical protein EZV62_004971 [Acer yangbiense]|uniref:Reverse transcriptase Ty1/copia-type domain-containing protein n=1 Tax=Acer yangbiense TaxID=1000413 RepID=A0A5C7INJ9_9ROSI|nr:hypothetical protein EZV62_004971 [Acer yangbiense]
MIRETKHGEMDVTRCFNKLQGLWQELDLFYDLSWECSKDIAKFKKTVEKDRIFDFLAGLNAELDEVRGHIIRKESLPFTKEVFSKVRREENSRMNPTQVHYGVAKRILRYLQGIKDHGIWFKPNDKSTLIGYTNSDWARSVDDMKSTSRYTFSLGSGIFSWSSTKQDSVA